jgi:hypothetical protein
LFTRRKPTNLTPNDPLLDWFYPSTAELLRQAADELGLNSVAADTLDTQSCVAAVSLFKTTRGLLSRFQTSNPTWMRAPRHHAERVRASRSDISKEFTAHLRKLIDGLNGPEKQLAAVRTADARFGPLSATQVDLVLGSPPYCTRIDYAKATQVELATMGIADADFRSLRNRLSGTTSIKGRDANESTLPPLIETLLADIKAHPSHGSATYYHPTIRGYFEDIKLCMKAIAAGLAPNGRVILVVQDSYYKEMRIPIQEAFELLAAQVGLELRERVDESISAPKSIINRYSKKYRSRHEAIESVLSFTKGTSI